MPGALHFKHQLIMFVLERSINRTLKNPGKKLKSNNPKILMKMNNYLRHLFDYFENVLHPASGWSDNAEKRKRKTRKTGAKQISAESFNTGAGVSKKHDKIRRNPAP
jgi:hypothetical protein